jgi:hypothetical protein
MEPCRRSKAVCSRSLEDYCHHPQSAWEALVTFREFCFPLGLTPFTRASYVEFHREVTRTVVLLLEIFAEAQAPLGFQVKVELLAGFLVAGHGVEQGVTTLLSPSPQMLRQACSQPGRHAQLPIRPHQTLPGMLSRLFVVCRMNPTSKVNTF